MGPGQLAGDLTAGEWQEDLRVERACSRGVKNLSMKLKKQERLCRAWYRRKPRTKSLY